MRRLFQAFLVFAIAVGGIFADHDANAESSAPEVGVSPLLKNTSPGFLALETAGAVVVFAGYSIAAGDLPETCSWCEPTGFDTWVRNGLVASHPKAPALVSHVLSLGVIPAGALAGLLGSAISEGHANSAWQDAWIMVNTFVLTTGITDGTKKLVARERPGFHYGIEATTEAGNLPGERNLSFYSGDTAWAFSLAASGSTLAFLHGYRVAPWIAVGGGVAASTAGLLRIAADMHWATDVMTGAAVGTGIGIAVPLLLHGRKPSPNPSSLMIVPMLGGGTEGIVLSTGF